MTRNATIANYLAAYHAKNHAQRLNTLRGMSAPEIVIDREQQLLDRAVAGDLNVGGDASLLDREFTDVQWLRGNGGKPFAAFTTDAGAVRYFPAARYGRFITE